MMMEKMVDWGLRVYGNTFKRVRPAHRVFHKLTATVLVPVFEKVMRFATIEQDPLWFRVRLLTGSYEPETVKLVKQHVKAGMTVLDIGANVGYYSKLFSKLVGDQGQVISFEPHPMTFKVLSENVSPPGNVRAIEAAISDKNGKSEFFDFLVDSGGSSLRFDAERRREQWDRLTDEEIIPKIVNNTTVARYSVTTRTVDSVLQELGVKTVDFIKMDIEGAEIHAISGMGTTLKNSPHLQMVMELNPRSLQSFGLDANAAFAQLKKVGFDHISLIDEKTNFMYLEDPHTLADLERSLLDGLGRVNILCKMGG